DKHPVLWHANGHLALGPETLSQIDAFIHDRGVDKNSPLYNTSSPFYLIGGPQQTDRELESFDTSQKSLDTLKKRAEEMAKTAPHVPTKEEAAEIRAAAARAEAEPEEAPKAAPLPAPAIKREAASPGRFSAKEFFSSHNSAN
ncbi:MAG: hypothetical protein HY053_05830, partial [Proteobacteria bacterium]|nr:hypothetical protein [Pseudomonadota bacterium]